MQELVGTKGFTAKLVNNRDTRSALKYFTKCVQRLVRAVEYGKSSEVIDNLSYKNGAVLFRLEFLLDMKGGDEIKFTQSGDYCPVVL